MRKALSVLLVAVFCFSLVFGVTGCKNSTVYSSPEECVKAYIDGEKIVGEKCMVVVKVNEDRPLTRRGVYCGFDRSSDISVIVSIPMDETVTQGESLHVYITDIKASPELGIYEIYGYTKR